MNDVVITEREVKRQRTEGTDPHDSSLVDTETMGEEEPGRTTRSTSGDVDGNPSDEPARPDGCEKAKKVSLAGMNPSPEENSGVVLALKNGGSIPPLREVTSQDEEEGENTNAEEEVGENSCENSCENNSGDENGPKTDHEGGENHVEMKSSKRKNGSDDKSDGQDGEEAGGGADVTPIPELTPAAMAIAAAILGKPGGLFGPSQPGEDEEEGEQEEEDDYLAEDEKNSGTSSSNSSASSAASSSSSSSSTSTSGSANRKVMFCPKDLPSMAEYILSDECQSIVMLTGAGISVSSGIPDYRSEGGFYDSLNPDMVTASEVEREIMKLDPSAAVEKELFLQNPFPLLELKREFILGTHDRRWKATIAHRFIELLHAKTGKLTRCYTQNIDGLESQCQRLPSHKVLPVHGSMARAGCMMCGTPCDTSDFYDSMVTKIKDITGRDARAPEKSSEILCNVCGYATVKPTVVLFHEPLPKEFFMSLPRDLPAADLLIIMGTSLSVGPANSIAYRVPEDTLRMVVNREPVGRMVGIRYDDDAPRDFFAQGCCDDVCLELIKLLGWMDDLVDVVDDLPKASADLVRKDLASQGKGEGTEVGSSESGGVSVSKEQPFGDGLGKGDVVRVPASASMVSSSSGSEEA